MDSDLWITRLAAAKRQFNMDRVNMDDIEIEEETRPEFPCPFCYEEFDISSLCSHLEDDHSFDTKPGVCPVCSVRVSRNMLSHITMQHGHLFRISFSSRYHIYIPYFVSKFMYQIIMSAPIKYFPSLQTYMQRRRRLRKIGMPNNQALSLLGRELREAHLQVLLGGSGYRTNNAMPHTAATDPFLSNLVLNFSASETDEITKAMMSTIEDNSAKSKASQYMWKSSFDSSLSLEEREQRTRQAAGRAVFIQDLLVSTLLTE